jgi:periplasmic protein TonB
MSLGQVTQIVTIRGKKSAANPHMPPPPELPKRIRVGGSVEAAHITFEPRPVYPASAEKRGVEGTVVLQAVIGIQGQILSLSPLSGPDPALIEAAMNAVRQWRYQPTLLNGVPAEVATTIEVVFQLGR